MDFTEILDRKKKRDPFAEFAPLMTGVGFGAEAAEAPGIQQAPKRPLYLEPEDQNSVLEREGWIAALVEEAKRGAASMRGQKRVGRAALGINPGNLGTVAEIPKGLYEIGAAGKALATKDYRGRLTEEQQDILDAEATKQARLELEHSENPIIDKESGFFKRGLFSGVNSIAGWLTNYAAGLDEAVAGAAAGAGIGALVGGVGAGPGAAAGFKWGMTTGSAKEWYFQGQGEAYMDMVRAGIDPEAARKVSTVMALPYAGIEFLFQRLPGIKTVFNVGEKTVARMAAQKTGRPLINAAKAMAFSTIFNAPGEMTEEALQSWNNDIAYNMAANIDAAANGNEVAKRSIETIWQNMKTNFIESAIPSLMMIFGGNIAQIPAYMSRAATANEGATPPGAPPAASEVESESPIPASPVDRAIKAMTGGAVPSAAATPTETAPAPGSPFIPTRNEAEQAALDSATGGQYKLTAVHAPDSAVSRDIDGVVSNLGHRVVWFEGGGPEVIQGAAGLGKERTIFLNTRLLWDQSLDPVLVVATHEMTHRIKFESGDAYSALKDRIFQISGDQYQAFRQKNRDMSEEQATDEFIAKQVESFGADREFWNQVFANTDRGIVQKIVEVVGEILSQIARYYARTGNTAGMAQAQAVRESMVQAFQSLTAQKQAPPIIAPGGSAATQAASAPVIQPAAGETAAETEEGKKPMAEEPAVIEEEEEVEPETEMPATRIVGGKELPVSEDVQLQMQEIDGRVQRETEDLDGALENGAITQEQYDKRVEDAQVSAEKEKDALVLRENKRVAAEKRAREKAETRAAEQAKADKEAAYVKFEEEYVSAREEMRTTGPETIGYKMAEARVRSLEKQSPEYAARAKQEYESNLRATEEEKARAPAPQYRKLMQKIIRGEDGLSRIKISEMPGATGDSTAERAEIEADLSRRGFVKDADGLWSKPKEAQNAVQKRGTETILPRKPEETGGAGGVSGGVGQGIAGETPAIKGQTAPSQAPGLTDEEVEALDRRIQKEWSGSPEESHALALERKGKHREAQDIADEFWDKRAEEAAKSRKAEEAKNAEVQRKEEAVKPAAKEPAQPKEEGQSPIPEGDIYRGKIKDAPKTQQSYDRNILVGNTNYGMKGSSGFPVKDVVITQNSKWGADRITGVVASTELRGRVRETIAPVILWKRNDGKFYLISGRHRYDIFIRNGKTTIPANIVYESDGFTEAHAVIADIEDNITNNTMPVKETVQYFKKSGYTKEEAEERTLLSTVANRAAFSISQNATQEFLDIYYASERINVAQAETITREAKGDAYLQGRAAEYVANTRGVSAEGASDFIANLRANRETHEMALRRAKDEGLQMDLFGGTDFKAIEERLAKASRKIVSELTERARTLKSALRLGVTSRQQALSEHGITVQIPGTTDEITKEIQRLATEAEKYARYAVEGGKYREEVIRRAGYDSDPLTNPNARVVGPNDVRLSRTRVTMKAVFEGSGYTITRGEDFGRNGLYDADVAGKKYVVSTSFNPAGARYWFARKEDAGDPDKFRIGGEFPDELLRNIEKDAGVTPLLSKFEPTEKFKAWFRKSQVVDDNGKPLVVYSGHSNAETYGAKYSKRKGIAGGFYASEDPGIASGYATGKLGDFRGWEYGSQYRFRLKNGNFGKKIWQMRLTEEQQERVREFFAAEDRGQWDIEKYWKENAPYDSMNRRALARGGLADLQSIWQFLEYMGETISYPAEDATGKLSIVERQTKNTFEELLDYLGIEWQSEDWLSPGVMPVYLRIENPLDAEKPFPKDLLDALKAKAKYQRTGDAYDEKWRKTYPLKQWIKDIESGNEFWTTQIPEEAVPIIQQFGYDGIREVGLKGIEDRSQRGINWIAFEPTQIKSAFNRGTWDAANQDIRLSRAPISGEERSRENVVRGIEDISQKDIYAREQIAAIAALPTMTAKTEEAAVQNIFTREARDLRDMYLDGKVSPEQAMEMLDDMQERALKSLDTVAERMRAAATEQAELGQKDFGFDQRPPSQLHLFSKAPVYDNMTRPIEGDGDFREYSANKTIQRVLGMMRAEVYPQESQAEARDRVCNLVEKHGFAWCVAHNYDKNAEEIRDEDRNALGLLLLTIYKSQIDRATEAEAAVLNQEMRAHAERYQRYNVLTGRSVAFIRAFIPDMHTRIDVREKVNRMHEVSVGRELGKEAASLIEALNDEIMGEHEKSVGGVVERLKEVIREKNNILAALIHSTEVKRAAFGAIMREATPEKLAALREKYHRAGASGLPAMLSIQPGPARDAIVRDLAAILVEKNSDVSAEQVLAWLQTGIKTATLSEASTVLALAQQLIQPDVVALTERPRAQRRGRARTQPQAREQAEMVLGGEEGAPEGGETAGRNIPQRPIKTTKKGRIRAGYQFGLGVEEGRRPDMTPQEPKTGMQPGLGIIEGEVPGMANPNLAALEILDGQQQLFEALATQAEAHVMYAAKAGMTKEQMRKYLVRNGFAYEYARQLSEKASMSVYQASKGALVRIREKYAAKTGANERKIVSAMDRLMAAFEEWEKAGKEPGDFNVADYFNRDAWSEARRIIEEKFGFKHSTTKEWFDDVMRRHRIYQKYDDMGNHVQASLAYNELMATISTKYERGLLPGLKSYLQGGLLSGPPTHVINIWSNTWRNAEAATVRTMLSIKDGISLILKGNKGAGFKLLGNAFAPWAMMGRAWKKGLAQAIQIMETGVNPSEMRIGEDSKMMNDPRVFNAAEWHWLFKGKANPLGLMRYVGRLLRAQDYFFRANLHDTKYAELRFRAMMNDPSLTRKQINKIINGELGYVTDGTNAAYNEAAKRADELGLKGIHRTLNIMVDMHNALDPTLREQSELYSAAETFNDRNPERLVGRVADAVRHSTQDTILWWVGMFSRVAANVTNYIIDCSPAGLLLTWKDAKIGRYKGGDFRVKLTSEQVAERSARAAIGTLAFLGVMLAAARGKKDEDEGKEPWFKITARGPKNPAARKLWSRNNRPFTITVGGKKFNYIWYGPLALSLAAVGAVMDELKYGEVKDAEDKDGRDGFMERFGPAVLLGTLGIISEGLPAAGLSDLAGIMYANNTNDLMRFLERQATSFGSAFFPFSGMARFIDRSLGPTVYTSKTRPFYFTFLRNFPLARQQFLMPLRDIWGEPVKLPRTESGNFVDNAMALMVSRIVDVSPPDKDIEFLAKVDRSFSAPQFNEIVVPEREGVLWGYREMNPQEYDDVLVFFGAALKRRISRLRTFYERPEMERFLNRDNQTLRAELTKARAAAIDEARMKFYQKYGISFEREKD